VTQGTETISLGPVTVLAAGTQNTSFTEADESDPPLGKAYFYVMQFRFPDGTVSTYGSDSAGLPREPTSCEGGCP
jgi:hypothetical protein